MKKQERHFTNNNHKRTKETDCSKDLTRREFIQFSSFAMAGVALSLTLNGCNDSSSDDNKNTEALTFDKTTISPGQILGIKESDSPGLSEIPEDIFSVTIQVDDKVTYNLRPTYFSNNWIGVFIPLMVQADGSYVQIEDVEVSLVLQGILEGKSTLTMNQNLSATVTGTPLTSLLSDIETELVSIDSKKDTLFENTTLMEHWNEMYPKITDGLDWLSKLISSAKASSSAEVLTIEGDKYTVSSPDVVLIESMIEDFIAYEPKEMANGFVDSLGEPGKTIIKKLNALLGYVLPGAFVSMTVDLEDENSSISGNGAIAAILNIAVPAACMCLVGNCLSSISESAMSEESVKNGLNWYANVLMNLGLYALNDQMICDFGTENNADIEFVVQEGIELLDNFTESFWDDSSWSNNTPWSNGTPWSNNSPWSNNQWTNQPWNHTPWNNATPWNHAPWSNNAWNNNTWNNNTPWSDNAWNNNTPWSNNTWNNNWNNNIWNNFVNSGIKEI